jgi:phage N-6-adenine-methyltransferase
MLEEAPEAGITRSDALAIVADLRKKPKGERKAPAGGIVRTCLDVTWRTPRWILAPVDRYYGGQIPLDPCTHANNPTNAKVFCAAPATDGLAVAWREHAGVWVNPPYGKVLKAWLDKIALEARHGAKILSLLPASRFEQAYFMSMLGTANMVCLVRGRVAFVSSLDGAEVGGNPYASWIVGFNVDVARFVECFPLVGACFRSALVSEVPARSARPHMTRGSQRSRAKKSRCYTPPTKAIYEAVPALVTPAEASEF